MDLPLVLLPGSLCDSRLFQSQVDYFSSMGEVLVADFAGHDSIKSMAAVTLTKLPDKFSLVGLSMGGIVALEMVKQAPNRVQKLGLFATNPSAESNEGRLSRDRQMSKISQGGVDELVVFVKDSLIPNYNIRTDQSEIVQAIVLDMALQLGPKDFLNQWKALKNRSDSWSSLANIRCPTLLISGTNDAICNTEMHHEISSKVRNAQLKIIKGAGHLSTMDSPILINQILDEWLNS